MDTIISKSNEKVKYFKSLNDKKFRQKYNAFYLEGIKVVTEILENKAIDILFIAYSKEILQNLNGGKELLKKIDLYNDKNKVIHLSQSVFEYIVDTTSPQGVFVVLKKQNIDIYNEIDNLAKSKSIVKDIILLDKVQDLGNLGTIIRSAVAFGIKLIIATSGTADFYSPKVIRSTMGAINKVKIAYIDDNISQLFNYLKTKNYEIFGTSLKSSKNINEMLFNENNVFVLGNEANGVSEEILSLCDSNIKIPMLDNMESLNVSVATSIIMYKNYIDKLKK